VWVRDEEQTERAKAEFEAFAANRGDPKYAASAPLVRSIRKVAQAREERARRNVVDMRQHWRRPAAGSAPVVMLLILASIVVTLLTSFGGVTEDDDGRRTAFLGRIWIAEQPPPPERATLEAVRGGEVWRLVTPILLHLSPMHLLFNMMWLYHLGMAIESIEGSWRFALMVLVIAVLSNVAQFYFPHPEGYLLATFRESGWNEPSGRFGGMSGVVYGLFGYIWIRARRDPLSRYFADDQTVVLMLVWFVVCLLGLVGPVANTAHGMGLLVGMAVGYAAAKWRLYRLHH
jgi:GlpG protein